MAKHGNVEPPILHGGQQPTVLRGGDALLPKATASQGLLQAPAPVTPSAIAAGAVDSHPLAHISGSPPSSAQGAQAASATAPTALTAVPLKPSSPTSLSTLAAVDSATIGRRRR